MFSKRILVTGGAGFIGSNFLKKFVCKYPSYMFVNLDKLTYAGNIDTVQDLDVFENYKFIKGDICDLNFLNDLFSKFKISDVVHFAAESHVDRSIENPFEFAQTNIIGTLSLLQASLNIWGENSKENLFYHISTDEVYGSLGSEGYFKEITRYDPRSPYSSSKASSDHFVRSFFHTYNMKTIISNCSNNYGPFQFPEKLIPRFINNIIKHEELPVYGNGKNIRDWLHVSDHVDAIDIIFHKGQSGETYNIGGGNEIDNLSLIKKIIKITDSHLGNPKNYSSKLIKYVQDRKGHDFRYAIDFSKLKNELGWSPKISFDEGIRNTIRWYIDNSDWIKKINSEEK